MRPAGAPQAWAALRVAWARPDAAAVTHPLLDAAERARCARLGREADRARHATGRVLAKIEGARRLRADPRCVAVVPDVGATAGRPLLLLDGQPTAVHLSIAHAGDAVMVGLGDGPCGVDVEEIAALKPALEAGAVFSARERARLAATSPGDRLVLAARWWTGKEAALKALGIGLAVDPATIDADSSTVRVRALGGVTLLRLVRLEAPPGYCATLAFAPRTGPPHRFSRGRRALWAPRR